MGAVSSYSVKSPPADTDFVLGADSGGTVYRFDLSDFILRPETGTVSARFENTGASRPSGSAGVGIELIGNAGGSAYIQSWNATSSGFAALFTTCSQWVLQCGGVTKLYHNGSVLDSADPITVPANAYGAGWNGSLKVATEDAVYDKIETFKTGATTAIHVGTSAPGSPATGDLWVDTN